MSRSMPTKKLNTAARVSESNRATTMSTYEASELKSWQETLKKARSICSAKAMRVYEYVPSRVSPDPEERAVASRLNSYRAILFGRAKGRTFPSVTDAIRRAFPHWLEEDMAECMAFFRWRALIRQAQARCKALGVDPAEYMPLTTKPEERHTRLALINYKKQLESGKGYEPVTELIAETFPHWLENGGKRGYSRNVVERWRTIIEEAKARCDARNITYSDYRPSLTSNDKDDHRLAIMLQHYRLALSAQAKIARGELAPGEASSAAKYGTNDEATRLINEAFPLWLMTPGETAVMKWSQVIEDAKGHCQAQGIDPADYFPSVYSKDDNESKIAKRLANYGSAHRGIGQMAIYPEVDALILDSPFLRWHSLLTHAI